MASRQSYENFYWENDMGPYCGIFGHSFIRRLCVLWQKSPKEAAALPWRGEAHGIGGLRVSQLLSNLQRTDLSGFDVIFVQIGENDMMTHNNHQLMASLIDIMKECSDQGVQTLYFGSQFPRHDRSYNTRRRRFNKIFRKMYPHLVWDIEADNYSINPRDGVHLLPAAEPDFARHICEALRSYRM